MICFTLVSNVFSEHIKHFSVPRSFLKIRSNTEHLKLFFSTISIEHLSERRKKNIKHNTDIFLQIMLILLIVYKVCRSLMCKTILFFNSLIVHRPLFNFIRCSFIAEHDSSICWIWRWIWHVCIHVLHIDFQMRTKT